MLRSTLNPSIMRLIDERENSSSSIALFPDDLALDPGHARIVHFPGEREAEDLPAKLEIIAKRTRLQGWGGGLVWQSRRGCRPPA